MHVEFLVRRGAALPGRLGTSAGVAAPAGAAALEPRLRDRPAAAAVRVPAAAAAPATQVAVPPRAPGRRRGRHARAGLRRADARGHRPLLSSAIPRAVAAQQERAGGPRPSGPVPNPAATSSRHHRHRADHHQRVGAKCVRSTTASARLLLG